MSLADACHPFQSLLAHEFGAKSSVEQVGLRAVAVDARRVGEEDADVVQHGRLFHKLAVDGECRVAARYLECPLRDLAAMQQQEFAQRFIVGVVFIYQRNWVHCFDVGAKLVQGESRAKKSQRIFICSAEPQPNLTQKS